MSGTTLKQRKSDANGAGVLDQSEVMKAMLAARAQAAGSGSGSDDDDESGSDEDEDESGSESGDDSDAEAGSAAKSLASSASRSPSPPPRVAPTSVATTSRVKLPPRADAKGKAAATPADAFDGPRAAEHDTFASLGLSAPIINALAVMNIRKPTEIQSACVPPILAGRDCIGGAKTGSGKTMAFALPILESIARDPFGVYAVVLTPTRELAYQLSEQFLAIGRPLGLTTATIVGGMDMLSQAQELERRPHVIVATPGRLVDLLRSDAVGKGKLSRVRTLVLDEADRMLTPTFAPELAFLFEQIPAKRQTLLFTATISDAIMDLAKKPPPAGKQPPFVYRVASDTLTVDRLKQKYLFIPSQIRDPYLYYLLLHPPSDIDVALRHKVVKPKDNKKKKQQQQRGKRQRSETPEDDEAASIPPTIVFTQRCATAHLVHLMLQELGIPSVPLHSHLTQPQRLLSLARFRAAEVPVLVTTDVGSRGLDIPEVAMVVNWDCPRRGDDYVHRVGRTARAGRGGVAVTVVTEHDVELVKSIEEEVKVTLTELELPEETVLENLNKVSVARRVATMEMHDSGFGERQAINKAKAIKRARRDAAK
ncbi:ATP-dependent RNA helicase DBP8 [Vanrija pseudolonga]|uniref:ATP-dependent RNA helicase DBP8 n=1 Tax=Vanrija pseudolonga TaxID=143232 RepID=A0AAF1BP36_9TREE|nr:ATP-dependent RNA helicase DBP8 [Vanrija pseudolonga]